MQKRIDQIKLRMSHLSDQTKTRMKSKIQSYDIRDCPEYEGILELEKLLRSGQEGKMDYQQIFKTQKMGDANKTLNEFEFNDEEILRGGTLNTSTYQNPNESKIELISTTPITYSKQRPVYTRTRDIGGVNINKNKVAPVDDE